MLTAMPAPHEQTEVQRLADVLEIELPQYSNISLARAVSKGFPYKSASAVKKVAGAQVFKRILSRSTLERAQKKRTPLSKDSSEKLYDYVRVRDRILQSFNHDEAAAERFFHRPNLKLDNETPFSLTVSSTAGANAVINLLEQADAGFAA